MSNPKGEKRDMPPSSNSRFDSDFVMSYLPFLGIGVTSIAIMIYILTTI